MRMIIPAIACTVLALTAPALPAARAADAEQAPPPAAAVAPAAEANAAIREITLDPRAPASRCRKVAPTGSRIATRQCTAEQPQNAAVERAESVQRQREFEEMRATQFLREQTLAQARAEALRRRAMGR